MATRLELQHALEALDIGKPYFQPPASVRLQYPCVIYDMNRADVTYASDRAYAITNQYSLMHICKDPDESQAVIEKIIRAFPRCNHDRTYIADNLYHQVFSLYF